jgi:hypothetical protein
MKSLFQSITHALTRSQWWLLAIGGTLAGLAVIAQVATTTQPSGSTVTMSSQVTQAAPGNTTQNSTNSVATGDTVQWMAQLQNKLTSPGITEGVMTLPPNFTWYKGSVFGPNNMVLRWNIGTVAISNWVTTEPNTGTVVAEFGWTISPLKTLEIKPLAKPTVNFVGTGDGYRIFTYKNDTPGYEKDHLYVINHHAANAYLNCRDAQTGLACVGFETGGKSVSSQSGVTLAAGLEPTLVTPSRNIEHFNNVTGEVFFYTADANGNIRVLCANLNTLKSCATSSVLATAKYIYTYAQEHSVNPIGSVGSKFFALTAKSDIICYDTSTKTACAGGYPFKTKYSGTDSSSISMNIVMYDRLFYIANGKVACFNTTLVKDCTEPLWQTQTPIVENFGLYPILDVNGNPYGVCAPNECRYLNGGVFYPSFNSNYKNFLDANQMFTSQGRWGLIHGSYTQANK